MVRLTCKPPILQHPILIRHLFNSRKLQNIKVRRNAAGQNEKKKKTKKDPHLKPNHWSYSNRPKTQPPVPESIHWPASHACPCDPWWDRRGWSRLTHMQDNKRNRKRLLRRLETLMTARLADMASTEVGLQSEWAAMVHSSPCLTGWHRR
jgi:hypothetical protein